MIIKQAIVTVFLLFTFLGLNAQIPFMPKRVNVHFFDVALKDILTEFSQTYRLQFSYSKDHLLLDQKLRFSSNSLSLDKTLQLFFKENNIACNKIAGQWVLKSIIPKKKRQLNRQQKKQHRKAQRQKRKKATLERGTLIERDLYLDIISKSVPKKDIPPKVYANKAIKTLKVDRIGQPYETRDHVDINQKRVIAVDRPFTKMHFAQISILPFLSSNGVLNHRYQALSFNVFWGMNTGVNGLELGLVGNSLKKQLRGLQIAGFFNHVNGKMLGLQLAGLLNMVHKEVYGLQAAGLWNVADHVYGAQLSNLANISNSMRGLQVAGLTNIAAEVYGFQLAGLLNFSNGQLIGSQIAGFGNIAWGGKSAVQLAGIFNSSAKAQFQGCAIYNHAQIIEGMQLGSFNISRQVKGAQIGLVNSCKRLKGAQIGLINHAKNAAGLMLGLINVADSVQGASIGLINIIKNGYNRLEISGSESVYLNFGAKFGLKKFYHIVQGGWTVNSDNVYAWSMGLGIGTALSLKERFQINFELLTAHLNENTLWTAQLNLLNQFKITLDILLSDRVSLFIGPSFNLIISELYHSDTQSYGSNIMPYHFFNSTHKGRNTKMWIGFTAGLRF